LVRGLYTSAAGALVAQANIDNIANNLANVSTNGFKRTLLQIQSQPQSDIYRYQTDPGQVPDNRLAGTPSQVLVGQLGSGAEIYATPTQFDQGQIAVSGNTFDFALSGPGFFAVRNAAGTIAYTRDGEFLRGADGTLVTQAGDEVLDAGGNPINIPAVGKVEVDTAGNIDVNGVNSAQIAVFEFNNRNALTKIGSNDYIDGGQAGVHAATQTSILQYAQEKSNADVVRSIVDLITNERWFEANEKSIQTQDAATNQAISQVGNSKA
jgi:flagellar basal-body rod protein FlgF